MNEWLLLLYPPTVFAYLMLASRLQPKGSHASADEPDALGHQAARRA